MYRVRAGASGALAVVAVLVIALVELIQDDARGSTVVLDQRIAHGDGSSTVTKSGAVGTNIVVSGTLSEKDSGFNGKDDSDSFSHSYTSGSNWGTGNPHPVNLVDNNLNATLNYIIERV